MDNYLWVLLTFSILTLLSTSIFILVYKKEKRSLWLAVSFLLASGFLLSLIALLLLQLVHISFIYILLISAAILLGLLIALHPLILIFSLITSGIRLIRREGVSISHILSLTLGIAYIVYLIAWPILAGLSKPGIWSFLYTYLSFCFTVTVTLFILYTITNGLNLIRNPFKSYTYIIVLGSGLIHGDKVPPLLASRLDKGIEAYKQNPGSKIICSGGQGLDETIAEGVAMKDYLLSEGIENTDILVEDKSVSTKENLLFSKAIIDSVETDTMGNILVVTNRYHVLRALLLARDLGIPCDGRGSKTKLYFSINAFIREWIAYLSIRRKMYVGILASGFVLIGIAFFILKYILSFAI